MGERERERDRERERERKRERERLWLGFKIVIVQYYIDIFSNKEKLTIHIN